MSGNSQIIFACHNMKRHSYSGQNYRRTPIAYRSYDNEPISWWGILRYTSCWYVMLSCYSQQLIRLIPGLTGNAMWQPVYDTSCNICTRFTICCALLWLGGDWRYPYYSTFISWHWCTAYPIASKATLKNIGKYISHNHICVRACVFVNRGGGIHYAHGHIYSSSS